MEYSCLAEAILAHGEETPGKTAVILKDAAYTYAQLAGSIRKMSVWLKKKGLRKGDRVLVESAHTFEYLSVCYGTHLSNCVLVPVENGAPAERMREIAEAVGAGLIIANGRKEGADDFYMLPEIFAEAMEPDGADFCYVPHAAKDPVEILFTTGTTGKSKGVTIGARAQITGAEGELTFIDIREDDVWVIPMPMNHGGGLWKTHMILFVGGTAALLDGFRNMNLFFDFVKKSGATGLYLPPMAIHLLITFAEDELRALDGQIRFTYSASAVYPQADKDTMKTLLPHARMYNGYSASEVSFATVMDINTPSDKEGRVGKPSAYTQILILDEKGEPMASSSRENCGRIAIRNESVMLGYWNEPELTAETLINGDTVITSDLGYIDDEGFLVLVGRAGDVINLGGMKVSPTEVEELAATVEGVDECLLIPAGNAGAPYLKLLVVPKAGMKMDSAKIAAALAPRLEAYKLPKRYLEIPAIMHTFNGKIDRKRMIAEYQ